MRLIYFRFHIATIFLFVIFITFQSSAQSNGDIGSKLDSLYRSRSYAALENYALRLLLNADSLITIEQAELHKYLGIVYIIQGREDEGKLEFIRWLKLDSNGYIDSFNYPPRIVEIFQEAKAESATLTEILPGPTIQRWEPSLSSAMKSVLVPGWGQIVQGKKRKGIYIFTAQAVSLSGWLVSEHNFDISDKAYHTETDPEKFDEKYDIANNWNKARWSFIAASIAVYVFAQTDFILFTSYISLNESNNISTEHSSPHQFSPTIDINKFIVITIKF